MTAAEFVHLVKQYPCIYNSDLPEYARKDTTEKAWRRVANALNWTVAECKDKWKNIRNGYVRSLKPSYKGVPKKPYYLCDELQFLLPYINPATNIQIDLARRMPSAKEEIKPEIEELQKENEAEIPVSPDINSVRQVGKRKTKFIKKTANNNVDKAFTAWLKNKKTRMNDTRKMFLFSLLPDVRKLSEEQLGVFRIKVLLLLEELKKQSGAGLQELLHQMK